MCISSDSTYSAQSCSCESEENLAQWIKVTLTQGLAFTNGVKFYTFLVLFFPCKIPMPIYFYGISIFSLLSAITILMSFARRICIASTTIPQLIFLFILVTCLLDIVFILYSKILFQSPMGANVMRNFQHHGQSQRQQLSLIIYPSKFLCTYHDHNYHKQHEEVHDKCLQKKQIHKKSEHEQSNLLIMSCMNILI